MLAMYDEYIGTNTVLQSNFINANVDSANSSLARTKSWLIRGEILVPTPNISSIVCPVSLNCRRRRWCEKLYPRHNTFID